MNINFKMQSKSAQQGAVLLEALIAFLIFSMGLLGVIGLQATAINNTLDARYRSDAAFLANQIIAQMWADAQANTATVPPTYSLKTTYACNPCTKANGNANTQAWVSQIQTGFLPGVTDMANQPIIAIAGNQVTVTMRWQSPQGDKKNHSYITRTEIQFN